VAVLVMCSRPAMKLCGAKTCTPGCISSSRIRPERPVPISPATMAKMM
jgi:hypothetical protein